MVTEKEAIRVLIVDDHAVVRSGLTAFLKVFDDLQAVGEADSGAEAIHLCEQVTPDVILMDLVMPRMDGRLATQAILERWPDIRIIVLTSFREKELVQGALQAGAIGYLLKTITTEELLLAIRAAQAGRHPGRTDGGNYAVAVFTGGAAHTKRDVHRRGLWRQPCGVSNAAAVAQ